MAESEKARAHRLEQWREKRRLKKERAGDTPQKRAERKKPGDQPSVSDNAKRAGIGAFGGGGGIS